MRVCELGYEASTFEEPVAAILKFQGLVHDKSVVSQIEMTADSFKSSFKN